MRPFFLLLGRKLSFHLSCQTSKPRGHAIASAVANDRAKTASRDANVLELGAEEVSAAIDRKNRRMMQASGQLSQTRLNREHRVLVLGESLSEKVLDEVIAFHTELGIPIRTYSIHTNSAWGSIYCFTDLRHAATFQIVFGGELGQRDL